jgi:hypothetical protein
MTTARPCPQCLAARHDPGRTATGRREATQDPPARGQAGMAAMREHDVSRLTTGELERARRELAASLALARPGSPARTPIAAQLHAVDAEIAARAAAGPPRPAAAP